MFIEVPSLFQRRTIPSLKFIIVGDYAVGKTSLCKVFAQDMFQVEYKPTIGVDILTKTVEVEKGFTIKLQIWDLAGQQRFFEVMTDYYKGAKGGAVVFDITRLESFESVEEWVETVRNHSGNIPLLLVGNKVDLDELRTITSKEAKEKAKKLNLIGYIESSAKNKINVEDVFLEPMRVYLKKLYKTR